MAKLVLDDIGSTLTNTAATTINSNNTKIEQALENTLSRDGSTPNNMQADIDMDSNDLLNVNAVFADSVVLGGEVLIPGDVVSAQIATQAEAEARTDNVKIMTSLRVGQAVDFYGLTKAGNLAGLANPATARDNLGVEIGSDVQAFDADLSAIAGLSTAGIATRTAADTWTTRSLVQPAAGITITNPAGIAGDPTFALANDLAGVEGLAATGLATRTAADTWTTRTITGTANKITVTNGDGVAGAPTLTIPDAVTLVTPTVTGLLNSTGGQIQFPAVQVPSSNANTLDDYEEGTWTPTLQFGGASTGITYSTQTGTYIKIGRSVTLQARITLTSKGSATGNATIVGAPFFSDGPDYIGSAYAGNMSGLTSSVFLNINTTSIAPRHQSATQSVQLLDTNFTATSDLILTVTFRTSN